MYIYLSKEIDPILVGVFIVSIVFALIVILAPGNAVRSAQYLGNHNILFAMFGAVGYTLLYCVKFVTLPATVLLILVHPYIKDLKHKISSKVYSKHARRIAIFVLLGIFVLSFVPSLGSLDQHAPRRVTNMLLYLSYTLALLVYAQAVWSEAPLLEKSVGYVRSKFTVRQLTIFFVLAFFLLGNHGRAWRDLILTAPVYDHEMKQRYALISRHVGQELVVPNLSARPLTLHIQRTDDITEKPEDWRNQCYAKYFGLKPIRLEKAY